MKHSFKTLLTLALALVAGNAWGATGTYSLVTDASSLSSGDVVVFGCAAKNVASSGINGKYIDAADVTINSGVFSSADVVDITLIAVDGGWNLKIGDKFINTTAAKALTFADEASTVWTISITDGTATVSAGDYGRFLYNVKSPRFLNYTSAASASMLLPELYKKGTTPPTDDVLESLVVSGTPTKTEYEVGEAFDPAGLTVTGTYSESGQKVVTSGITWTADPETFTTASTSASVSVTATVGTVTSPAYNVTGLTVTEPITAEYSLVTDASKLKAGDKLLIVGIGNNAEETYYALKQYESGNNCKTIAIPTPVDGTVTVDVDGVDVITLGGEAGAWTLFDGSNYLYAAGGTGSNNYLKGTASATNDNAKWTIAIADGKATVKTKDSTVARHTIRFNQTSSLFACYASGQSDVYIYKLAPKSYDATITSAGYATLYLDFAAAIPAGVTAYTAVAGDDAVTLTEVEDVIPANTAVVLEGAAGTYTFEEATTTAAAPANDLKGTLVATDWETINNGQYIYVLGQKDGVVGFYKLSETGSIKANSAYLALDEDPASGSIVIRKGDATAISLVQENLGEAVIYDLLGRRVSEPMRGIYIVNGKKMFIK